VTALATADTATLDRFGRFLQPFRLQVKAKEAWSTQAYLIGKEELTKKEFYNPTCVR
jgi:hypothetical protein